MSLALLLDGYLHQDFVVEYGNAESATHAFVRDATVAEVTRARAELDAFIQAAEQETRQEWLRRLRREGGAWRPRSLAALRNVAEVLHEATSGSLGTSD